MGFFSSIKGRLAIALQVGKSEGTSKAKVVTTDHNGRCVSVRDYVPKDDKELRSPVMIERGRM